MGAWIFKLCIILSLPNPNDTLLDIFISVYNVWSPLFHVLDSWSSVFQSSNLEAREEQSLFETIMHATLGLFSFLFWYLRSPLLSFAIFQTHADITRWLHLSQQRPTSLRVPFTKNEQQAGLGCINVPKSLKWEVHLPSIIITINNLYFIKSGLTHNTNFW